MITAAFAFNPDLQNNKIYVFVGVNVVFWSLTLLNLLGIWSAKARAGRPDRVGEVTLQVRRVGEEVSPRRYRLATAVLRRRLHELSRERWSEAAVRH